jgi:hypothetical protein
MGYRNDIREILSSDGKLSSKRVITMLAFILVSSAFIANLTIGIIMSDSILDGMIQIVWAGLGVTVGERIFKNRSNRGHSSDGYSPRDRNSSNQNRNEYPHNDESYRNNDISNPDEEN